MSLSRFFILRVLCCRSLHGYDIAKEVAAITEGCCAPTEGSLYPVLHEFERVGLVTSQIDVTGKRERKVYTLTEKGYQAYQVASQAWAKAAKHILREVSKKGGGRNND
jgi:DNA-binding PadR family transcriptional regulator